MGNWDIKPALYDNEVKNCLVATYGIQGLAEKHDFFGYLDVYFNYDSEGNYQIMDLQFEEYDPTATVTDSSTDGDETAENQADSTATDAAGLVTDFNALLAKLKAAGLMAADEE